MNRLIENSNQARAYLEHVTGIDALEYDMLILNSGCEFVEAMSPATPLVTEDTARRYQMHLIDVGFFDWYLYQFRTLAVELWKRWNCADSPVAFQPKAYKRQLFLDEVAAMRIESDHNRHLKSFDNWLVLLDAKRILRIKAKQQATQPVQ